MHKRALRKPDGRELLLYSRRPIAEGIAAPSPGNRPSGPNPHLRWHPLRGEWVAYAQYRQNRTFMPKGWNPLAPTADPEHPTELPAGDWDIAVFQNLFPTLSEAAHDPPLLPVPTRPARGVCEVVVFTRDPNATLGGLPLDQIELLIEVWADRWRELGALADVEYVFPFENRGAEVGVTLPHPHGQIYAYPFVPPIPARELALQAEFLARNGRGLLETILEEETARGGRHVVYAGPSVVAWVPVFARYSYEVWIAPRRAVPSLAALDAAGRSDFARALKTILLKYDGLWNRPFPYIASFHQAPTDGRPHPEAHAHLEFYPAYRRNDRLKYLAGSEMGAGMFTADTLPEEKAEELRRVAVDAF
jgi:UDPglucose--hexose-1-phosphate uridylyltransferase